MHCACIYFLTKVKILYKKSSFFYRDFFYSREPYAVESLRQMAHLFLMKNVKIITTITRQI